MLPRSRACDGAIRQYTTMPDAGDGLIYARCAGTLRGPRREGTAAAVVDLFTIDCWSMPAV